MMEIDEEINKLIAKVEKRKAKEILENVLKELIKSKSTKKD